MESERRARKQQHCTTSAAAAVKHQHHHYHLHHQQQLQQQQLTVIGKKIPVVYYLCRNRHLEHPHFVEVPLSSPDGLYLRDVIERLNAVRGKGMAAMYSWSCKRGYKNGFVWHDLSEDDLVLPATGNEYVLKGSELVNRSPASQDRLQQSSSSNAMGTRLQNVKLKQSVAQRQKHSSSAFREAKASLLAAATASKKGVDDDDDDRELSPPPHETGSSSNASPETRTYPSPDAAEYRICNPVGAADASTQTYDTRTRTGTCTRGMTTEDCSEIDNSPMAASSNESASWNGGNGGDQTETLESLISGDVRKISSFRVLQEPQERLAVPLGGTKSKSANMIMQLITCGSIAVKDHRGLGVLPAYRSRVSQSKLASPVIARSMECLSDRFIGLKLEDKEYFSGSLIETKKEREDFEDGAPVLKRSNSYNGDRCCKSPDSNREKERVAESPQSKCLPRTIKASTNKQPRNETMQSPLSEGPRESSGLLESYLSTSLPSSKHGSKRFNDASSAKCSSMRMESFRDDKEKVIQIEESLLQELGL